MSNDSLHRQWSWSENLTQSNPWTCWALFFAFTAIGPSVQCFPALHPFVVGSHRVLFGGVHCGFSLFNGWCFALLVLSPLASRQQQDGHSRHCCCRNEEFGRTFHGMLLFHHLAHALPSFLVGDSDEVDACGQHGHVDLKLIALVLNAKHLLPEHIDYLGLMQVFAGDGY